MSITSKSPLRVACVALATGKRVLPRYGSRYSRRDYTLAQLFACLVMRKFLRTDYRGICAILAEWPELCQAIELFQVPHFTTLQKAEKRLLNDALIRKHLTQTIALYFDHGPPGKPKHPGDPGELPTAQSIELAAADSTGFEATRCSTYFTNRRKQGKNKDDPVIYRRFPKCGIVVDCDTHLILATHRTQGPSPDVNQLSPLLKRGMCANAKLETMLADAGYDSEGNHKLLREKYEIVSHIPPRAGRPTNKLPSGKWRWLMATDFNEEIFGQRWQVETVMFMMKARQGAALMARGYHSRRREMGLIAVTHNILILRQQEGFYCGSPLIADSKRGRHNARSKGI